MYAFSFSSVFKFFLSSVLSKNSRTDDFCGDNLMTSVWTVRTEHPVASVSQDVTQKSNHFNNYNSVELIFTPNSMSPCIIINNKGVLNNLCFDNWAEKIVFLSVCPVQYRTVNLVKWIFRTEQNKYWKLITPQCQSRTVIFLVICYQSKTVFTALDITGPSKWHNRFYRGGLVKMVMCKSV